jgi:hypothetical protein
MRISDCEFEYGPSVVRVEVPALIQQSAIRNPKFEIYVAA